MTVNDVKHRIEHIKSITDDHEAAHEAEDDLWQEVLQSIALGECTKHEAEKLAAAALETMSIDFFRWYA